MISEEYRRRQGSEEVIGWYFDVTVRQAFDYSKYPLDTQDVWLRLWHKDFDRGRGPRARSARVPARRA